MSKIAELIRDIRTSGHLSQSEISRKTGIPQPRISRWESGDVAAGADDALLLLDLARDLGISTEKTETPKQPIAIPSTQTEKVA